MLGELVADVRKVLALGGRLSPTASRLMPGRTAEGRGVANGDERKGEGWRGEENDNEGYTECCKG